MHLGSVNKLFFYVDINVTIEQLGPGLKTLFKRTPQAAFLGWLKSPP